MRGLGRLVSSRSRAALTTRTFFSTPPALRDFYESTLPEAPAAGLPPPRPRRRHRANTKRAGHIMQELTRIHGAAKLNPRIEPFRAGDAIEIKHVHNVGDAKQQTFKGVVLAVRNKGLGSNFIVRNVLDGEAVEYMFPKFSPLIHSIKVLQKAFIHKGRKRVRRAKLYYLRDRPPAETTVR